MSRIIDADAYARDMYKLNERLYRWYLLAKDEDVRQRASGAITLLTQVRFMLDKQPTIDAVPVVHGYWRRGKSYPHNIYCSNCFRTYVPNEEIELWKDQTLPRRYCPECGALMDEVTE